MSVWLLHLPEERIKEEGEIHLPFDEWPDVTHAHSQQALRQWLKAKHPGKTPEALSALTQRLWVYVHGVHVEDVLAVPVFSRREVAFAQVLSPVRYENGRYVLAVRWFPRRVAMRRFKRHRALFEPGDMALREITHPPLKALVRDCLPLPGNRFRKWKWLLAIFMLLQLIRMGVRIWQGEAGF